MTIFINAYNRFRSAMFFATFMALAAPAGSIAHAGGPLFGLGGMLTFEHEGRQKRVESRIPFLVRGGYAWGRRALYVEYSTFFDSDQSGYSSVERRNHALLAWFRHGFAVSGLRMVPFIAIGGGAKLDAIRTRLDSQILQTNGKPEFLLGAAPGFFVQLDPSFQVGGELRVLTAEALFPNPQLGAAGYLAFQF
jgi:hypothetical protein